MLFAILLIHLISALWTVLVLRSAIVSLHQTGKTQEEIQNVKKGYSFIQRFLLVNVKDASAGTPKFNAARGKIEKTLFAYLIVSLAIVVLIVFAFVFDGMVGFVSVVVILKTVLIDLGAISIFIKANTVIDKKNKTIVWKWLKK